MEEEEDLQPAADVVAAEEVRVKADGHRGGRRPYSSVASSAVTYKTSRSKMHAEPCTVQAAVQVLSQKGTSLALTFQVESRCAEYARQVLYERELWDWSALRVEPGQYELIDEVLGNGSFGLVIRATCRGVPTACKAWNTTNFSDVRREIALLAVLALKDHQHVCQAVGVTEQPELMVFLELCSQNLCKSLNAGHFGPAQKWSALSQICSALCHMHSINIVHMDLKSDNILVVDRVTSTQLPWIKVGDVGMGLWRSQCPTEHNGLTATFAAAVRFPWRAPEMAGGLSSPPVDMFAYAGLVVEVARGTRLTPEDLLLHREAPSPPPQPAPRRVLAPGSRIVQMPEVKKERRGGLRPQPPRVSRAPTWTDDPELPLLGSWVRGLVQELPETRPTAPDMAVNLAMGCAAELQTYKSWLEGGG